GAWTTAGWRPGATIWSSRARSRRPGWRCAPSTTPRACASAADPAAGAGQGRGAFLHVRPAGDRSQTFHPGVFCLSHNPATNPASQVTGVQMLEVRGVTRMFGARAAVDDMTFSVDRPAFIGIIGRSGAGKSTFLRMMNRLLD